MRPLQTWLSFTMIFSIGNKSPGSWEVSYSFPAVLWGFGCYKDELDETTTVSWLPVCASKHIEVTVFF